MNEINSDRVAESTAKILESLNGQSAQEIILTLLNTTAIVIDHTASLRDKSVEKHIDRFMTGLAEDDEEQRIIEIISAAITISGALATQGINKIITAHTGQQKK